MDQIFYIMIKGTLIATVAGIGVLALKPVFAKKFSVKMRYFLWLIIFSCLIILLQFPFEPLFLISVALSDNFYDGNVVLIPVEEDLVGLVDMNSNMLYNKYGEHIYYYK